MFIICDTSKLGLQVDRILRSKVSLLKIIKNIREINFTAAHNSFKSKFYSVVTFAKWQFMFCICLIEKMLTTRKINNATLRLDNLSTK